MKKNIFFGILLAVVAAGCTEHDAAQEGSAGRQITFAPTVESCDWNADTRGTLFTATAFDKNDAFGVSGYRYDGTTLTPATTPANFLYKAQITNSMNQWSSNDEYYWPFDGDLLDFYAYYPYNNANVVVKDATTVGPMKIDYTVNTNPTQQVDMLTASATGLTFNTDASVALPFTHQLTAVKLVLGANVAPGHIKSIVFKNIATEGTLTVGTGWGELNREDFEVDMKAYYDQTNGFSTTNGSGYIDAGSELTEQTTTLLMIPQTFTETNQKLSVAFYNDEYPDGVWLNAQLTGQWEAGKTVTYQLTTASINKLYVDEVTFPENWDGEDFVKDGYVVNEDAAGLFAIDNTGTVVLANHRYDYTSTGWTTAGDVLFNPNYTYFMYYPYQSTLSGAPVLNDVVPAENRSTARNFFSDVIGAWAPAANQTNLNTIIAQDLQIAKATLVSASHLRFNMEHALGLISLSLLQKTVSGASVRFHANGNENTYYDMSGQTIAVMPSTDFIDNKPYQKGRTYYYVVNSARSAIQLNAPSGYYNSWTAPVNPTVTNGHFAHYDVQASGDVSGLTFKGLYYDMSGEARSLSINTTGSYRIECWGAQGGGETNATGGKGAYTSGCIDLYKGQQIYILVGQEGTSTGVVFNNGGYRRTIGSGYAYSGGGSTDIRTYYNDDWREFESLKTRIMVAGAGGSATTYHSYSNGGDAGMLIGSPGEKHGSGSSTVYVAEGGEQMQGGWHGSLSALEHNNGRARFGNASIMNNNLMGTGGNGWYAGGEGCHGGGVTGSGAGGSSYISGHNGCKAITASSTSTNITHKNDGTIADSYNYEGYIFINTIGLAGTASNVPAKGASGTQTGNSGHGYCRIVLPITE